MKDGANSFKQLGSNYANRITEKQGVIDSAKGAVNDTFKNSNGSWNVNKTKNAVMLGGAATMVAPRLLSGGGIYKDKNGRTDLMGVPFF